MKINDKNVTLLNECNGEYVCSIENFALLAKNVSFYGDMEGYQKLCQNPFLSSSNPQSMVESQSLVKKEEIGTSGSSYVKLALEIILCYTAFMMLALVIYTSMKKKQTVIHLESQESRIYSLESILNQA